MNDLNDLNDIDDDWMNFCDTVHSKKTISHIIADQLESDLDNNVVCSNLNISTKTKISYLNQSIQLSDVFWKLPVMSYHTQQNGIVKKQMKFNSSTQKEVDDIFEYKKQYDNVEDFIINRVEYNGRNKFKDVRKISIGICKKDITSYRCKQKSAFYNCFVLILRILHNNIYKEFHVKIFNTGKLEIPGIQDSTILNKILDLLVVIMNPTINVDNNIKLEYIDTKTETVMINSNFNCGYYINREKLFKLLKYKYMINSNFDSCSYPGIQCEFYYDTNTIQQFIGSQPINNIKIKTKKDIKQFPKVSFMIFRTGSVLIVGKCSEEVLYEIYKFLCDIFKSEYNEIHCQQNTSEIKSNKSIIKDKNRIKKIRRKIIYT